MTAKKSNVVIVHESVIKSGQDVNLASIATLTDTTGGRHRLRIRIRANSYQSQSVGSVERWNGSTWQEVWTLEGERLTVSEKLVYRNEPPTVRDFAADVAVLLQRASEVIEL